MQASSHVADLMKVKLHLKRVSSSTACEYCALFKLRFTIFCKAQVSFTIQPSIASDLELSIDLVPHFRFQVYQAVASSARLLFRPQVSVGGHAPSHTLQLLSATFSSVPLASNFISLIAPLSSQLLNFYFYTLTHARRVLNDIP